MVTVKELSWSLIFKGMGNYSMGRSFGMDHPVWWGGLPAITKGFIDRLFLPGMGL